MKWRTSHWYNDPIGRNELYNALQLKSKVRASVIGSGVTIEGSIGRHDHNSMFVAEAGKKSMLVSLEEEFAMSNLKSRSSTHMPRVQE